MKNPIQIIQYETSQGKAPFEDWMESVRDTSIRTRILSRVDRLQLGSFGDCKNLGQGVFELRLHFGRGYRIYFGRQKQTVVILLCGGDKSNQAFDISRAKFYWHDYKRRQDETL